MKYTKITAVVLGLFSAANVMAMDIDREQISSNNPVMPQIAPSFASSEYPDSGWFAQISYGRGTVENQLSPYSTQYGQQLTFASNKNTATTNQFGFGIGYQSSSIQSHILQFLQVKRLSMSVDVSHEGATSQSGNMVNNGDDIFTYNANVKAVNRIMLDGKVNIFKVWHFSPYVETGVGLSKYSANYDATNSGDETFTNNSVTKDKLTYQYGAGLDWFVSKGLTLSAGYREINAGKLALPSTAMPNNTASVSLPLKENAWVVTLGYSF